jgi:hypothetical protein
MEYSVDVESLSVSGRNVPHAPSLPEVFRNKEDPPVSYEYFEHSWNAFDDWARNSKRFSRNPYKHWMGGSVSYTRNDSFRFSAGTDRTIATAIYNRLATDVTRARLRHVRVDENDRYQEEMHSGLNYILTQEANIDQTAQAFLLDLTMSMLDEGVVAALPIETTINPNITGSYDIQTMRTGKILSWKPDSVELEVYNEKTDRKEPIWVNKRNVAIIENPFYSVMNDSNSVLKRLLRKLQLLDNIDEIAASGKLDLIVQLPYSVKSPSRQETAKTRISELENQLKDSTYGVGYIDSTEKIIQLNRPIENTLMAQIEYLTNMLYSQLGITAEILNGTASESTMLNYYNRTINVILDAIVDEFERKFLTKTARSQKQAIKYYRDPFIMSTSDQIAEIADKFTRNEILSPNDVRGLIGFMPSKEESADELRNRNIAQANNDPGLMMEEPSENFTDPFISEAITESERYR